MKSAQLRALRTTHDLNLGRSVVRALALVCLAICISPSIRALPSFARQTGQKCAACHVSGSWPQLTPWGRFFKLSGYTAGKELAGKEGFNYVPAGVFGQLGITWAAQPNNSLGQPVITQNGSPEAYAFTGEIATKLTDFMGVFYEYNIGNTFPGWKGTAGPVDLRAVHFFHPENDELLVGIDSNNNPTVQDVWNSTPAWGYPFYGSPQTPGGPASPMITSLGEQSGSIGIYALLNREWYAEISFYRVGNDLFRWMTAGTNFQAGGENYLRGYNPYWRVYWTKESGPHSVMVGAFGMESKVYPDSSAPSGPTDRFKDYGFDSQYQYLGDVHKLTLRASYIYETQNWNASFPTGASSTANGNLKSLNLNGSYGYRDHWVFNGAYFSTNGNNNTDFYAVTSPSGSQLTSSPNTAGYVLEVDRLITQNLQATIQYKGFTKFNGLTNNIDGLGRSASANNTLWLTVFFAF
ncbi:MAG: hypothetical protein M3Y72_20325 [Acidobacteriota bacterium]|nr:hypothetical protein [Acidobacteriota bacterium]